MSEQCVHCSHTIPRAGLKMQHYARKLTDSGRRNPFNLDTANSKNATEHLFRYIGRTVVERCIKGSGIFATHDYVLPFC
jgi:hypothetical protein